MAKRRVARNAEALSKSQAMKRRDFMRNVAAVGAGASLAHPADLEAVVGPGRSSPPLLIDGLSPALLNDHYLTLLRAAGVNAWHKSVGDAGSYADVHAFLDGHRDQITLAGTVRDIHQAVEAGKVALILGSQSANFLDPPVRTSFMPAGTALRAFHALGLRICGICYQVTNLFGAGNLDHALGLTRWGRALIEEMHSLRIIVDVGGHTGEQTSLDAIAVSTGVPIICSHTNMVGLNPNARAISDGLAEAIARTGGVIGISAISDFHVRSARDAQIPVSPQATFEQHLDQYDYLRKLVGADHIGLGPDFVGDQVLTNDPVHSWTFPPDLVSEGPMRYVRGVESPTDLPQVIDGLRGRGWTDEQIRKLSGENWLRVYQQVWGA